MTSVIVVDNFYDDVDQVREHALSLTYDVIGNYPGRRTGPMNDEWRAYIRKYLEDNVLKQKITYWPANYNTAYQYTTSLDKTWIHRDETAWAGIIYLTPDAPVEYGTGLYRHKETGEMEYIPGGNDWNELHQTEDDWDLVNFIGNVYNRLVLYKGFCYHKSMGPTAGFGTDLYTGRLFQTFFFN